MFANVSISKSLFNFAAAVDDTYLQAESGPTIILATPDGILVGCEWCCWTVQLSATATACAGAEWLLRVHQPNTITKKQRCRICVGDTVMTCPTNQHTGQRHSALWKGRQDQPRYAAHKGEAFIAGF